MEDSSSSRSPASSVPSGQDRTRTATPSAFGFFATVGCGLAVFVVFSHFFPLLSGTLDVAGRLSLGIALLSVSLVWRRSARWRTVWTIPFAFFTALVAISADYFFDLSRWANGLLGFEISSPPGLAVNKLESSLVGIAMILALTLLSGQKTGSLLIRRGNWRLSLAIGLGAFAVMIAAAMPIAELFFRGTNLSWARVAAWAPWILIFVLANATNEELLFRGLFLGRLEPAMGALVANIATTIPFTLMHAFVDYSPSRFVFLLLQLLPLSLAWGWLAQRTKSIWGSVAFHAAMDIPIVLGLFSAL